MADTVSVMSLAHTAIRIQEPLPEEFHDKPGLAPVLRSAVIAGSSNADTRTDPGITHGVDAKLFELWHAAEVKAGSLLASLVSMFNPEEGTPDIAFGHEPGLEAAAADSEATAAAEKGSTITHEGPVSSIEMAATSNTPNDDSPRGDADLVQTARTQKPGTAAATPDEPLLGQPAEETATTEPAPVAEASAKGRGKKASDLDGPAPVV